MNPYPETPDSWIERREEHAPLEGAIWCSDCGEWIEEACEHYQVEQIAQQKYGYSMRNGKMFIDVPFTKRNQAIALGLCVR